LTVAVTVYVVPGTYPVAGILVVMLATVVAGVVAVPE